MIIGWDKKELISLRNKYNLMLKRTHDDTKELELIDTVGSLDAILESMKERKGKPLNIRRINPKDTIEYDLLFLRDFGLFAPYMRGFAEGSRLIRDEEATISRNQDSSCKVIRTVTEFYNNTNALFSNKYMSLLNGSNLRLKIFDNRTREIGCTFPVLGTDIVYMYVSRINSLQDYITLAHEMAHGISYYMNPEDMMDEDRMIYSEAMPIFFEMISNDYVANKYNYQQDGLNIKILTYNDYLHVSRIVCAMMDAMSHLSSRDLMNKKKLITFLKEYECCDEEDIGLLLTDCISEMFKYINSYLTAVEIYLVYLKDKEQAFELLRKMTMVEVSDPRKYLEYLNSIGIYPGSNINEYAQMLCNEKGLSYGKRL